MKITAKQKTCKRSILPNQKIIEPLDLELMYCMHFFVCTGCTSLFVVHILKILQFSYQHTVAGMLATYLLDALPCHFLLLIRALQEHRLMCECVAGFRLDSTLAIPVQLSNKFRTGEATRNHSHEEY